MIDLIRREMPLEAALALFEKESEPTIKEYKRHLHFTPERTKNNKSRHSGRGNGQQTKHTQRRY